MKRERGFSLLELMVATFLFTVIASVVFSLLIVAQTRYQVEKNFMASFQLANVAADQIARDVHTAGYPPANSFNASVAAANPQKVALPFAWSPNYPATLCTVLTNCTSPGNYDLIIEADLGSGVQWIRYSLQGTTLMRGVANKAAGTDPITATGPNLFPYLENVMNNATAAQMGLIRASYPSMFPGNTPVPVFSYTFDTGTLSQPPNIRDVNVTLIVQSPTPDPTTGQLRVVTLTGQATRINPNQ